MSPFGERLKRWFLPEPQSVPDPVRKLHATPINECGVRSRVRVAGEVRRLGKNPDNGWYEAELADKSGGTVRLIWMGRDSIDCLHVGVVMCASGRLARQDGELALYNPEFSVLPD